MNIPPGLIIHRGGDLEEKLNSAGAVVGVNESDYGAIDLEGLVERERVDER